MDFIPKVLYANFNPALIATIKNKLRYISPSNC